MAARTADGQPKESTGCRADHVMHFVGTLLSVQARVGAFDTIPGTADDEAGRLVRSRCIARQLLRDKVAIRLVFVEGPDYVVSIGPGIRPGLIGFEPIAFGESNHVEPMSRPSLAKMR